MRIDKLRALSLEYAKGGVNPIIPKKKRRKAKRSAYSGTAQERYRLYLLTPRWKAFRDSILVARGFKCEECGSHESLHVHHKTYKRKGCELPEDVQLLCKQCHKLKHLP